MSVLLFLLSNITLCLHCEQGALTTVFMLALNFLAAAGVDVEAAEVVRRLLMD